MSVNMSGRYTYMPTGHTTLLHRWINVNDVDSTLQQRRVPSGYSAVQSQIGVAAYLGLLGK